MGPDGGTMGLEVKGSFSRPLAAMVPVDGFALVAIFTIAYSILVPSVECEVYGWGVYRASSEESVSDRCVSSRS